MAGNATRVFARAGWTVLLAAAAVLAWALLLTAPEAASARAVAAAPTQAVLFPQSSRVDAAFSHALVWRALDATVICGVVDHVRTQPATTLVCHSLVVPAPKHTTNDEGDPGFVFINATGRPQPTRVSQYLFQAQNGWEPNHQAALEAGEKWTYGRIGVTCAVAPTKVRCANRSSHGFTITTTSYGGF